MPNTDTKDTRGLGQVLEARQLRLPGLEGCRDEECEPEFKGKLGKPYTPCKPIKLKEGGQ